MLRSIGEFYIEEASKIIQIFHASGQDLDLMTLERALRFSDYQNVMNMKVMDRTARRCDLAKLYATLEKNGFKAQQSLERFARSDE